MAWNRLMLTTVGKTLYAKAQQGKQLIFTRVGIGDGDLGTGSLVNRTALISEKKLLLIDAIQIVNETESAIITTLSNADITAGFYFREIGIFAKDPDTQAEQLYLYDNAGMDGEYIPDNQSGIKVAERLKFLMTLDNVTSVSFVASGNPIYLTPEDIDDTCTAAGTLWSSSKTKTEINAAEAAAKAASRPVTWTPSAADVGAIPATVKGTASGVAELDASGKVPAAQLPSYVDDVQEYASQSTFPASGESGKIYVALDTNKTFRWSGSAYVEISQSVALGETATTAYRGDRGKAAYDHSQKAGNPHGTTAAQAGAAEAVHSHIGYAQSKFFTNISVAVAAWAADAAYANWPYRASVALPGVTADMLPDVMLAPDDAAGGVLAPVAVCYAGGVHLYANAVPEATVTIPTIECRKVVS